MTVFGIYGSAQEERKKQQLQETSSLNDILIDNLRNENEALKQRVEGLEKTVKTLSHNVSKKEQNNRLNA